MKLHDVRLKEGARQPRKRVGPTLRTEEPMLPGFIIEQIRQREEEEQAKRPILQIELHLPVPEGSKAPECEEESDRGVVIIDLLGE